MLLNDGRSTLRKFLKRYSFQDAVVEVTGILDSISVAEFTMSVQCDAIQPEMKAQRHWACLGLCH